jgi:hypothetical protein
VEERESWGRERAVVAVEPGEGVSSLGMLGEQFGYAG